MDSTEELTFLPEGSRNRASPGVPPDDAKARQMTVISGRNLFGLWPPSGPVGACLRMCLESSTWRTAYPAYTLTWKRKATTWGASLFQLRLSAPRTNGNGSGYWATPRVEPLDAGKHRGKADSLHSQVKMLHTPTSKANQLAPSMVERDAGSYGHGMLPTPATSDWKGSSQEGQRRGQLSEVVVGMKLSAAWVSRLMGYPDGWMDDLPPDPLGGWTGFPDGSRQTGKKASLA